VLFNAHHDRIPFQLPAAGAAGWLVLVDTTFEGGLVPDGTYQPQGTYELAGRSFVLLQKVAAA
jgi:hypothetical protein